MPPLTSSRSRRLARGLFAATVSITGALGGPVAPAGAGAPAGHPTAATKGPTVSHSASTVTSLVTDRLGTHSGERLTPPVNLSDPTASRLGACDAALYGSGFITRLGSTWTALAIRKQPCTDGSQVGVYGTLGTITVQRETKGEFICRGRTYGYGSSVWFKTSKGYIWSGGTAHPRWNQYC